VAPPPVAGAAAGNGRGERVRAGDGRVLGLGVVVRLRLAPGAGDVLLPAPDGVGDLGLGVLTAGVRLGEICGDVEVVAPGDNLGSVALGTDPLQATTDAEPTTVRVAKPAAVTLARNPVPPVAARVFIWLLIPRKAPRETEINRPP
jgi:hypothetical protein